MFLVTDFELTASLRIIVLAHIRAGGAIHPVSRHLTRNASRENFRCNTQQRVLKGKGESVTLAASCCLTCCLGGARHTITGHSECYSASLAHRDMIYLGSQAVLPPDCVLLESLWSRGYKVRNNTTLSVWSLNTLTRDTN